MDCNGATSTAAAAVRETPAPCDEKNVLNALTDLKWEKARDLALQLDIEALTEIESSAPEMKISKLVQIWFRYCRTPTWAALIGALTAPCMDEQHIVRKINRFFLRRSSSVDRPKSPLTPIFPPNIEMTSTLQEPCIEKHVLNVLADFKSEKVRDLALQLDIKEPHLSDIESSSLETRKSKLVQIWFRHSEKSPTWSALEVALKAPCFKKQESATFERLSSLSASEPSTGEVSLAAPSEPMDVTDDLPLTRLTRELNKENIKTLWGKLLRKIRSRLQSSLDNQGAMDLRRFMIDYDDRCVCIPKQSRLNVNTIFEAVSKCENLWSFKNSGLLKYVINEYGDDDMKKLVDHYQHNYNGYVLADKLALKIPHCPTQEETSSDEGIRQLECLPHKIARRLSIRLKLTVRINKVSNQYLSEFWTNVREHHRIPALTAMVESILPGCLQITWLIAPSWGCRIIERALVSKAFYRHHKISKVEIDSVCIYDECKDGTPEPMEVNALWLRLACQSGKVPELENLVFRQGIDSEFRLTAEALGQRSQDDCSPFMIAVECNFSEIVAKCLDSVMNADDLPMPNALLSAVKKGYVDTVKVLINHGADITTTSEDDQTVAVLAAEAGHAEVIDFLINIKENTDLDFDLQNREGKTALYLAVEGGYNEVVDTLLKSATLPINVDVQDNSGMTSLMIAVMKRLPDIVYKIANRGADVDLVNNDGKTALILAAESGQKECVEILLEKNANTIFQQESTGKTALHFAAENGHLDVVHLLTQSDYKTDVTIKDKDGKTALDLARGEEVATVLKKAIPVAKQLLETFKKPFAWLAKSNLNSKLLSACKNGALDQVRICLERGADPNYRDLLDLFRWSGLMWASHHGHKDVVRLLLQKKAEPNIENAEGWTALILAARKANHEMVQLLVEHGADVTQRNKEGWTGLMWASQSRGKLNTTDEALENRRKTAEIMIAKDPSVVNISANDGWTPIMQASQDGHAQFVKILVDNKANLELVNKKKWTALMIASKHKRTDVVDALVQGKANVEHQKPDGMTALHVASIKGHKECIEAMVKPVPGVEKKVNVDIKDKWGMTPLILATKHGHKKSAEVLVVAGADVNIRSDEYAGWSPLFFAIKGGYLEIAKFLLVNKASMSTQDENKQTPLSVALGQKKEIYTKLIDFLQGKPQVLKAITSGSETIGSTKPHTTPQTTPVYTPAAAVSQTGEAAVPGSLQKSPTPTLEPVHDTITLKTLIEEAERTAVHRPLKYFKNLEREHNKYMADAMQSGTTAASAA